MTDQLSVPLKDVAAAFEIELLEDRTGFRVKETETHYIDVLPMIVNWRVTRSPKDDPTGYDRAWCFYGTHFAAMMAAVLGATAWDGADDTAPPGWDKNAMTGEYSHPREP